MCFPTFEYALPCFTYDFPIRLHCQCYFPHYSVTIRRIMSSSPGSHWLWFPHDSGPPKASRCRRSGSNGRRAFRTFRGRALLGYCWDAGSADGLAAEKGSSTTKYPDHEAIFGCGCCQPPGCKRLFRIGFGDVKPEQRTFRECLDVSNLAFWWVKSSLTIVNPCHPRKSLSNPPKKKTERSTTIGSMALYGTVPPF